VTVAVNLTGLASGPNGWHVHKWPVTNEDCSASSVSGHYNPGGGTAGELSQNLGTLTNPSTAWTKTDSQLTLFGSDSIIGRSIVIHRNDAGNSRFACATIGVPRTATVTFVNTSAAAATVRGTVTFTQVEGGPAVIDTDLQGLDFGPNGWHVHSLPVSASATSCSSAETGGHYNPTGHPVTGELSARHGHLPNSSTSLAQYIDENMTLFGPDSIVNRSIVIHKYGGDRWACASIVLQASAGRRRLQSREIRTPIDTTGMNHRQVERALLQCKGVVEETSTVVSRYNAGSGEMTGVLSGVLSIISRLWDDIYNGAYAILVCGPIMAGTISFLFIVFMSNFARLIIWVTIISCEIALLVMFAVFAYYAGMFEQWIDELVSVQSNNTLQSAAAAGVQALDATQAQVGDYLDKAAGDDSKSSEPTITDPKVYWEILAWITAVVCVLYPLVVLAVRRQIRLAIALVKEAGRTLRQMKMLLFYPFFTYMWVAAFFVYFVVIATFILSSTLDEESAVDLLESSRGSAQNVMQGNNVGQSAVDLFSSARNASQTASLAQTPTLSILQSNSKCPLSIFPAVLLLQ
jgi:Cu/Zn superoxide dismutase